jgi:hypothetical protein
VGEAVEDRCLSIRDAYVDDQSFVLALHGELEEGTTPAFAQNKIACDGLDIVITHQYELEVLATDPILLAHGPGEQAIELIQPQRLLGDGQRTFGRHHPVHRSSHPRLDGCWQHPPRR